MAERILKKFTAGELCLAKLGEKWHIRVGDSTHCGLRPIENIGYGIIGVREDNERICQRCLKRYHNLNS